MEREREREKDEIGLIFMFIFIFPFFNILPADFLPTRKKWVKK